jgi:lysosomal acid lipase/cholesteryl ester hydrolase
LLASTEQNRQESGDVKAQTVKYNKALLLMHAEDLNADGWVVGRTAKETLPFMIADLGYDVWLGNNRGVIDYSSHESLSESDREYWDFSFAEMGLYDVSAQINFILNETGLSKLTYMGFSRGNQQMFYALAHNEDYLAPKIDKFIALSPCAYQGVSNVKNYDGFFGSLAEEDIFVIYGPNWSD